MGKSDTYNKIWFIILVIHDQQSYKSRNGVLWTNIETVLVLKTIFERQFITVFYETGTRSVNVAQCYIIIVHAC